MVFLVD
jgi:hypothetical protein